MLKNVQKKKKKKFALVTSILSGLMEFNGNLIANFKQMQDQNTSRM